MNYNKISEKQETEQIPDNKETNAAMSEVTVTSIKDEPDTIQSTEEVNENQTAFVINCGLLNIRTLADKDSEIVCTVKKGTRLIIGGTVDGWTEVYDKSGLELEGYVITDYIKIEE